MTLLTTHHQKKTIITLLLDPECFHAQRLFAAHHTAEHGRRVTEPGHPHPRGSSTGSGSASG